MFTLKTTGLSESVTLKNLPTIRQTFVIASSIIAASYLLEYFVHPAFDWLPLLVAAGLMVAGISSFCPMVYFLQKLQGDKK